MLFCKYYGVFSGGVFLLRTFFKLLIYGRSQAVSTRLWPLLCFHSSMLRMSTKKWLKQISDFLKNFSKNIKTGVSHFLWSYFNEKIKKNKTKNNEGHIYFTYYEATYVKIIMQTCSACVTSKLRTLRIGTSNLSISFVPIEFVISSVEKGDKCECQWK